MAEPAASRSDVLRGRVQALDDLKTRTAAAPGGPTEPALQAKQAALTGRIDAARKDAAGELANRDRMEKLGNDMSAIRSDGLAQKEKIAKADGQMADMKKEFLGKYEQRPLKPSDLSAEDRARYKEAKETRDAAQKKLDADRSAFEKKKDEYEKRKKEAEEKEKAKGAKEGDVADPCVSCIASEVEKLEEEAKKAEGERLDLARALTEKGGKGTDADKELVAKELAKLPKSTLEQMKAQGTKVVACQGSVTDYDTSLKGKQPGGWPDGSTWDSVPGMYDPNTNKVVVATIGQNDPGGAHVPITGEGHGSANLTVHEAMHGVDAGAGGAARSTGTTFGTARGQDVGSLGEYETQAGAAGPSETWAESSARYYGGGGGTTGLDNYWKNNPVGPGPAASTRATTPAGGRGGSP
jgi:hypothetical protein